MFGYVIANQKGLTEEELQVYRGAYCGLCRVLGKRWGLLYRFTVNFDLTFLIILLSAMDVEIEKFDGTERCLAHPTKRHAFWQNKHTEYAADMNIALVYHNLIDDWRDEKSFKDRIKAWWLGRAYKKVEKAYPEQCLLIKKCTEDLWRLEEADEMNIDHPASCFGRLLAGIMSPDDENCTLWRLGYNLGMFIYVMDAAVDLPQDIKKDKYNPLIFADTTDFRPMLTLLIAAAAEEFEKLDLNRYQELLRNILYSGVWSKYEQVRGKTRAEGAENV